MASLISRARATALMATLGALCVSAATAADMPFGSPLPPPPSLDQPVEFGTGWYLRGDVGYSNMPIPAVVADFANNLGRTGAASGGLGFGYQYNSWLRTDFTLDRSVFRPSSSFPMPTPGAWCPFGTAQIYNQNNTLGPNGSTLTGLAGYLYSPNETCTADVTAHLNRTSALVNAYIDFGNWFGLTPYVGAGIGMTYLQSSAAVAYYQNNGQAWAPNLGQAGVPEGWVDNYGHPVNASVAYPWAQINPNQYIAKKSWKFAWNLMAGVSYDVSQNLKIDVGYRLLDAGSYTSLPAFLTGTVVTKELISQEVRIGVRLTSD